MSDGEGKELPQAKEKKPFSFPWKSTVANFLFALSVFVMGTWWGGKDPASMGGVSGWCFVAIQMFLMHRQRNADMAALDERFGGALSSIYTQLDEYKIILERLNELSARFVSDNAGYMRFAHINEESNSVFTISNAKVYEIYNATWNIEMYDKSELGKRMYEMHEQRLRTAEKINYYVLYEDQYNIDATEGTARSDQQFYVSLRDMERFLTEFVNDIDNTRKRRFIEEKLKEKWTIYLLKPNKKLDKSTSFILAKDKDKKLLAVRLFVNSPIFMDYRNAHKAVFSELNEERFQNYDVYLSERFQTCDGKGELKEGSIQIEGNNVKIVFKERPRPVLPAAAQPMLPPVPIEERAVVRVEKTNDQPTEAAEKPLV
jgi:hypothetical protein